MKYYIEFINESYKPKLKEIKFRDYRDFKPNLTPKDIIQMGSFGGNYFSNKKSEIKNPWEEFPNNWFKGLRENEYAGDRYNKRVNYFNVEAGASKEYWDKKKWINEEDPLGWFQWYCFFYLGRRIKDDDRQIKRWKNIAGENGRFKKMFYNKIYEKNGDVNDYSLHPRLRQTLLHWAYFPNEKDYNYYMNYTLDKE